MPFITVHCPNCFGEVELDNAKRSGCCLYCDRLVSLERSAQSNQADSGGLIENYFTILNQAYSVENYEEVENYCNRILELDATNAQAWLLKGKAAIRLSNTNKLRYKELVGCYINAASFLDGKNDFIQEEFEQAIIFTADFVCQLFEKTATKENAERILAWCGDLKASYKQVEEQSELEINHNTLVVERIDKAVRNAWSKHASLYSGTRYPDESQWRNFVSAVSHCLMLTRFCIKFSDESKESNLYRYRRIMNYNNCLLESRSFVRTYHQTYGARYQNGTSLDKGAREEIIAENRSVKAIIDEIEAKQQPQYSKPVVQKGRSSALIWISAIVIVLCLLVFAALIIIPAIS